MRRILVHCLRLLRVVDRSLQKEQQQWFLWTPVAFASGIIIYFYPASEPSWWFTFSLLFIGIGLVLIGHRTVIGLLISGLVFWGAFGFTCAKIRTGYIAAPVLAKSKVVAVVQGWAEVVQKRSDGSHRVTLFVHSLQDAKGREFAKGVTPVRVRISIRQKSVRLRSGAFVRIKAVLQPPPRPVWPGGFDYGRVLWFQQIGAVGFAISLPEKAGASKEEAARAQVPWHIALRAKISSVRQQLRESVSKSMSPHLSPVAIALITGDRGEISDTDLKALRDSGLAHILAISGLHMAVMAGTIYFLMRCFLALFPVIALNYPVRTISALFALFGGGLYLIVSGAAVSTQRAYIMTFIMLLAVMTNRSVISLRNVALAALLILMMRPESILDVGFQMSFASVTALVAIYEMFARDYERKKQEGQILSRPTIFPVRYLSGIASTTIIAGTAVAPIAVFHFYKLNQLSVLGNLFAMPITVLIIMPMVLLTFALVPFGLEAYPLLVMEYGLSWLMAVASYVSSSSWAVQSIAKIPEFSLFLVLTGGLWLAIWKSWWRFYGLFVISAGLAYVSMRKLPDLIIDESAKVVAVRSSEGTLIAPRIRRGDYSLSKWLLIYGDSRSPQDVRRNRNFKCDYLSCIVKVKGVTLSYLRHPHALYEDCQKVDILVSPLKINRTCKSAKLVIDYRVLKSTGAYAVYIYDGKFNVDTVVSYRYGRPWSAKRKKSPVSKFRSRSLKIHRGGTRVGTFQ